AGEALRRGSVKPVQRRAVVRRSAPTVRVHHRQIHLGRGITLLRSPCEPFQCFSVGVVRTNSQDGSDAELILFERVSLLRQFLYEPSVAYFLILRRQT